MKKSTIVLSVLGVILLGLWMGEATQTVNEKALQEKQDTALLKPTTAPKQPSFQVSKETNHSSPPQREQSQVFKRKHQEIQAALDAKALMCQQGTFEMRVGCSVLRGELSTFKTLIPDADMLLTTQILQIPLTLFLARFGSHRELLEYAIYLGYSPLEEVYQGHNGFDEAAKLINEGFIDVMLSYGFDPNATSLKRHSTLAKVLILGSEAWVRTLHAKGFTITSYDIENPPRNIGMRSVLTIPFLKLLRDLGFPLHDSAFSTSLLNATLYTNRHNPEPYRYLVQFTSFDPNITQARGMNAMGIFMHHLDDTSSRELLKLLIDQGYQPRGTTFSKRSFEEIIHERGRTDLIPLLEE